MLEWRDRERIRSSPARQFFEYALTAAINCQCVPDVSLCSKSQVPWNMETSVIASLLVGTGAKKSFFGHEEGEIELVSNIFYYDNH